MTAQARDEAAAAPGARRPLRVPGLVGALLALLTAGSLLALPASGAAPTSSERRTVASDVSGILRAALVGLDANARGALRAGVAGDADVHDAQRTLWALAASLGALLPARRFTGVLVDRRRDRRSRHGGSCPSRAPPAAAAS